MSEHDSRRIEGASESRPEPGFASSDRLGVLEKTLERLLGWIGAIDARIGFVFTVDVAMVGVLAGMAPDTAGDWSIAQAVWSSLAATSIAVSLIFLIAAVFPRLNGPRQSLLYFGGIASYDPDKFRAAMSELSRERYFEDLADQCHRNAEIATRKYRWLRWAMVGTAASVFAWTPAVYVLYEHVPG